MNFLSRNLFLYIVFLTGASVLVIEVAAVRMLAPWYGNTIYTFSSVLSVILAALSIGYYAGGKLADRHPSAKLFFAIITAAGFTVYLCQLLAVTILQKTGYQFSIVTGPLVFSMVLFFIPALLLGTLSPWAIKLQSLRNPDDGIGTTAGKVFFWGTIGSILGSLAAGFLLIPHVGLNTIMLGTGTLLTFMGLIGMAFSGGSKPVSVGLAALAVLMTAGITWAGNPVIPGLVYEDEGVYERIQVRDVMLKGRPARTLQQDRAVSGLIYLDNGETLDYVRHIAMARLITRDAERILAIGGGTYILPRVLVDTFPAATVDVAEIEPSLYDVGQEYFGVRPSPRLVNHITDGRRFLHDAETPYDLIYTDVFYAMTIPSHFATLEFYQLVHDRLTSGGIYMANVVGDFSPEAPNILYSQMRIIREIFPNSHFFATVDPNSTETQSVVVFAIKGDAELDLTSREIATNPDPTVRSLPEREINTDNIDWDKYTILTDNYAPAEYFALFTLRRELTAR